MFVSKKVSLGGLAADQAGTFGPTKQYETAQRLTNTGEATFKSSQIILKAGNLKGSTMR